MTSNVDQRKSKPERKAPTKDPDEIAAIEAENGLRQTKFVIDRIDECLQENGNFILRPSLISTLNRRAIEGLSELPGTYRPGPMTIVHSGHVPPQAEDVPRLVEDMCEYVNANWTKDGWHLASYLMWRLNWIHPFEDGNGRTSRAISYLVLCIKLGLRLPGHKTIPEFIAENKGPYYAAIDEADSAVKEGRIDVTAMERLLKEALTKQLADFADAVTGGHLTSNSRMGSQHIERAKVRWTSKLHEHYNNNSFWYWFVGAILAVTGIIFSII